MPERGLKLEVTDGIREVRLGAYNPTGIQRNDAKQAGTAVVRNRMPGGEGGRGARAPLLPD